MTKVVNNLLTSVDSRKPSNILSLDISAAFYMLDHNHLLKRVSEVFGLNGHVINWLKSYLTVRSSYVSLGNCHSTTVGCATGVPQGSILGPQLFSIFTTPVGHHISYHQFADDTQLFTSVDHSSSADNTRLSLCAEAVTRWHIENSLLLNVQNGGTGPRHSSTSHRVQ